LATRAKLELRKAKLRDFVQGLVLVLFRRCYVQAIKRNLVLLGNRLRRYPNAKLRAAFVTLGFVRGIAHF